MLKNDSIIALVNYTIYTEIIALGLTLIIS